MSNLRGFGYTNLDFGITKDFVIKERWNFEIRGEAFNAFNMHSFTNNFVADIENPSFWHVEWSRDGSS